MIKINLLPLRAHKKKETAQQQITLFVVLVVGVICVAVFLYFQINAKIKATEIEIGNAENKIAELKKKIGEIEKIKALEAEVKKKLQILDQLRKGKTGPVNRLATLSEVTPEKLWLTNYNESGDFVNISGISLSEDIIADFMNNLKVSPDYGDVELIVTEQIAYNGMKAKKFDITCRIKPRKTE